MRTAAAFAASPSLFARKLSTVGVQLYTLRGVLPKQPLETLKALEQIGYREVEAVGGQLNVIWDALKQTSLRPVSIHLDTALFMRNAAQLPAALEDAKKRGFEYAVCPYVFPQDRGGVEAMKKLADSLNQAGEQCRKLGLKLCYHNHAFEFAPAGNGQGTLLDVLLKATDKKLVGLELDIMWVKVAGIDPVSALNQYKGRVELMHVKNVDPTVQQRFDENVPRTAFREVGKGAIDVAPVLRAATKNKVKHYFVEQDQTPGDPLVSLRESFDHLRQLDF